MALDEALYNPLQRMVAEVRSLLTDEFSAQLQSTYGIQPDGSMTDLDDLGHLDDAAQNVAAQLRELVAHHAAAEPEADVKPAVARTRAVARMIREQAFTTLNRFAAMRMAEERGLIRESVGKGVQSSGFKVYERVAGSLGGSTYARYRAYLHSLFDELALDLPPLFDRYAPQGLLFPREPALDELLARLNKEDLAEVWAEDETIGWIYQFFNGKDEIKQMRDEGRSGPRNSREMAVRNQFFTPRYVVAFLVDNTLGRLWVEMTKGQTDLASHLDYFARHGRTVYLDEGQEVTGPDAEALYVPHRPLKDPRDIRLLDPACGSMHFGLYAFDVFERIYLDAWDRFPSMFGDIRSEGWDRDRFRRAVPALILQHNLHGVDIDRRALQIAGLALWLRAQRAWHDLGVPPTERPRIRRTHLVCAEPMPGEADLLRELQEDLERRYARHGTLLGELVEEVWSKMRLAGEAGTLLRIEAEIEEAVEQARREAEQARQADAFEDVAAGLDYSVQGVSRRFFHNGGPIRHVLRALHDLAARAEAAAGSYQRRLFEEDAEQGFAFIELSRQRYDVIVMNPPFGDAAVRTKDYIEDQYLDTKSDVLQAFIERAQEMLSPGGYVGAITNRTPLFLSTSQDWRERIVLRLFRPLLLADLGYGVLDATVEVCAYVMRSITEAEDKFLTLGLIPDLLRAETTRQGKFSIPKYVAGRREPIKRHQAERELKRLEEAGLVTEVSGRYPQFTRNAASIKRASADSVAVPPPPAMLCFRLLSRKDRACALSQALRNSDPLSFAVHPSSFNLVPASAFVYWVSDEVRSVYRTHPPMEVRGYAAKQGLATADDPRFVRTWWEVLSEEIPAPDDHPLEWNGPYCLAGGSWLPIQKGGRFSPYFSEPYLVANWKKHGEELDAYRGSYLRNPDFYFRPGLTWPARPYERGAFSVVRRGSLFSHTGMMLFPPVEEVWAACAIVNSDAYIGLLHLLMPRGGVGARQTLKYEVGYIKSVPIPDPGRQAARLQELALKALDEAQKPATSHLYSHHFWLPALLQASGKTLKDRCDAWAESLLIDKARLAAIQEEINEIAYDLYGIRPEDRTGLLISLYGDQIVLGNDAVDATEADIDISEEEAEDEHNLEEVADPATLTHNMLSYIVGVLFGRFDVRFAVGQRDHPASPNPSDALPRCSPGMLLNSHGLPTDLPPSDYPLSFPRSGILVEDLTDPRQDSFTARFHEALHLIFGEDTAAIEHEAASIFGACTLEDYFRQPSQFFDAHYKQYTEPKLTSASRRAPIYLPLQVPSGLYTVWVYYPRLSGQTFFTILQDHVSPRLETLGQDIARLKDRTGTDRQAQQRLEDLVTLRDELTTFHDELLRLTRLPYRPNLNDGVELSTAPLHNLFQHTSWRRHLEKRWQELLDGQYDWAHLARAIWPDRVEEKCKTDRSLAIAHGLEELHAEQTS